MFILNKKIFILLFLLVSINLAQTDWVKWEAKQISYELISNRVSESKNENLRFGLSLLNFFRNAYSFLISDLDGDNCPFYPSCSRFFIESVKESGLIKGMLMFSDRFIRDVNLFKNVNHYSKHISGKFFDPAYNYTLNAQNIKVIFGKNLVE